MIVYENYWYYRFVLYVIFFGGMAIFLTGFVLLIVFRPSLTLNEWGLFTLNYAVMIPAWLALWVFQSKVIIKVETDGDHYHLTSMTNKSYRLNPKNVKEVKNGERYHSMFLDNGKILYFERRLTLRGFLSTHYYDPWTVFLTQSRFPNAMFH